MVKPVESFYIDKFPIYACAYIAQDQILLAGGGGGKTKAGLQNKLLVYALSDTSTKRTAVTELVLAGDEDAPAALAVQGDLILAGVNEAEEQRRKSGENHHLRTYKVVRSTGTKEDAVTVRPTLSHGILELDLAKDDYQKQTRISVDGKYAALLSAEGKAALVGMTNVRRQTCKLLDEGDDVFVDIAFWQDALLVATKTALHRITLASKEDDTKEIFNLSRIRILTRYRLAHVAPFDKDRLVLGMNSQDGKSAFVALHRFFKGELRQSHVRHLPTRITGLTVDAVKEGQQDSTHNRKIAVAMGDGGVLVVNGRLEQLKRFRNLHQFPASSCAFAPNGQQLVTCSIDYKVNVLDLRGLGQVDSTRLLAVAMFLAVLLYLLAKLYF